MNDRMFHLNIRGKITHRDGDQELAPSRRLPREAEEPPSSELVKSHLDMVLDSQLQVALLERGLGPDNLQKSILISVTL